MFTQTLKSLIMCSAGVLALVSCTTNVKPGPDVPLISLKPGLSKAVNLLNTDGTVKEMLVDVEKGDEVIVKMSMKGDLFTGELKQPLVLRAQQSFRFYLNPKQGAYLSWDQENYYPIDQATDGVLSLGIGSTDLHSNFIGFVKVEANRASE